MITIEELLMGRANFSSLPPDLQGNLLELSLKINKIRAAYGRPMKVTSGYRRPADNAATANAAKASKHLTCEAVDVADPDAKLWAWLMQNLKLCKECGVWLEDKRWTPTWVHFQIVAPKSGKRIFVPSSAPAQAPNIWSGKYDNKFD